MAEADNITRNAKSNLAFTLMDLPEETRRNMAIFYAYCRIIDDIVDEPGMGEDERVTALNRWRDLLIGDARPNAGLEDEVVSLVLRLSLDTAPMLELIEGCRSDIHQVQPRTREDLMHYCYQVACCVGITSAAVMGASPAAHDYAVALGYALQFVNILRDMAEDFHRYGRIYIPAEDMNLFGISEEDIRQQRYNYRMRQMLAYEAALTEKFFGEADELYQALSVEDRNALIPAQAMKLIYHTILLKMRDDEYRVFERKYSVNNFRKLWFLLRARISNVELPSLPPLTGLPGVDYWAAFLRDDDEEKR